MRLSLAGTSLPAVTFEDERKEDVCLASLLRITKSFGSLFAISTGMAIHIFAKDTCHVTGDVAEMLPCLFLFKIEILEHQDDEVENKVMLLLLAGTSITTIFVFFLTCCSSSKV